MTQHVILFDARCPICIKVVSYVLQHDKERNFNFADLKSRTAQEVMKQAPTYLRKQQTLILLEDMGKSRIRLWLRAKAILRIMGLLGGKGKYIGWLAFPPLGLNWIYRLVSRSLPFKSIPANPFDKKDRRRFLP